MSDDKNISPEKEDYYDLVSQFVGSGVSYYSHRFSALSEQKFSLSEFNFAAFLGGACWAATRGLWTVLVIVAVLETVAVTQIVRSQSGNLGVEQSQRAEILERRAEARQVQAEEAEEIGSEDAKKLAESANFLFSAAAEKRREVQDAEAKAGMILISGVGLLLFLRLILGLVATRSLERQFNRWRVDPNIASGVSHFRAAFAAVSLVVLFTLTAYRYAVLEPAMLLVEFPASRTLYNNLASWIDALFVVVGKIGEPFFDTVTASIRGSLLLIETALVDTPWPVTLMIITFLAWHLAGLRFAIFATASLIYIGLIGLWENSMETVSLLGTAAMISIMIGVPLGIWCARSETVYRIVRPILDLMQTIPSFVYLIPIIAFFGTGKPPGIMAAIVFGMPPSVRLTALGLKQVPAEVKEAALAFGATRRFLLLKVEIPLALPSIKAGMNQTVLMCLALVVIAALIGAKGLGEDVLTALQYAANGEGILAGSAILLCAIILDRLVQGKDNNNMRSG
jgi:glycine betaine/proline transport system permease protein